MQILKFNDRFSHRFNRLQKLNKFTDCSFKIENKILTCHKLILAAASPVFEAMFYGNFDVDAASSILITDISFKSFQLFIEFLYTGELNDEENLDNLIEIAGCAQKYMIDDELKKVCVARISKIINRDNAFTIFAKSFKYRVEDFIITCLYYFVNALESGSTLCNSLILSSDEILQPECFEFLIKNLLDYIGEGEHVLMLTKAWLIHSNVQSSTSLHVLRKLSLDGKLTEKIDSMKCAFLHLNEISSVPRYFHRIYYKSVRPFIIGHNPQNSINISVSFRKFVIIKSLMLNSRLIPEKLDVCEAINQPYQEEIEIEIFDANSQSEILYKNRITVDNVFFNCSFKLNLCHNMVLFPHIKYAIKLKWNDEKAFGFEYPKAIYSMVEKDQSIVQFHEHTSIVQLIEYEIVN